MMRLWICVPGGDDDERERVVFQSNDIEQIDAAIEQYYEEEVIREDEYFMIENERDQYCFNHPDEWYKAFRKYFEPETLSQFLGRKFLS